MQETISRYSRVFHQAYGNDHHIVSPLGAWMLLALLAQGSDHDAEPLNPEVVKVLGMSAEQAGARLEELLTTEHPAVFSAIKAWLSPSVLPASPVLREWRDEVGGYCPVAVKVPTKEELNAWVKEKSLNLIEEFPVKIDPDWFSGLFATVVATDVEWEEPLKVVADSALAKQWGTEYSLRDSKPEHTFVHKDPEHGLFGVHYAKAKNGLTVFSVIAFSDIPESTVLEVAHRIGAGECNEVPLSSLESNEFLEIREYQSVTENDDIFQSFLPAWDFSGEHDLLRLPECGLSAAMGRLGEVDDIKQVVVADYSDKGFKAAALTYGMVSRSAVFKTSTSLLGNLLFVKPYAVVAVATDENEGSIWNNLPVFSGVVAKAKDIQPKQR